MVQEQRTMFIDSSAAIEEAFHQRSLGRIVSVGREPFEEKWYVRVSEPKAVQGA